MGETAKRRRGEAAKRRLENPSARFRPPIGSFRRAAEAWSGGKFAASGEPLDVKKPKERSK
jgi:hypothetical protein